MASLVYVDDDLLHQLTNVFDNEGRLVGTTRVRSKTRVMNNKCEKDEGLENGRRPRMVPGQSFHGSRLHLCSLYLDELVRLTVTVVWWITKTKAIGPRESVGGVESRIMREIHRSSLHSIRCAQTVLFMVRVAQVSCRCWDAM